MNPTKSAITSRAWPGALPEAFLTPHLCWWSLIYLTQFLKDGKLKSVRLKNDFKN
jgi:hypothetical protein